MKGGSPVKGGSRVKEGSPRKQGRSGIGTGARIGRSLAKPLYLETLESWARGSDSPKLRSRMLPISGGGRVYVGAARPFGAAGWVRGILVEVPLCDGRPDAVVSWLGSLSSR